MSLALEISIPEDPRPQFALVVENLQRPDIRTAMGRAIATNLREHFSKLDSERPNKLGGKRTHFWGQVRRSVQQPQLVFGDAILVVINHIGAAQRYFGGDIVPVDKEWLTVPARTEAYGQRARDFDDLHFIFFRAALAALVQNDQSVLGRRRKDGTRRGTETGGGIFFWLVKSIHQEPDPTVLPPEEELQESAFQAGDEYLKTLLARAGGNN